jgi:hypothetical protein
MAKVTICHVGEPRRCSGRTSVSALTNNEGGAVERERDDLGVAWCYSSCYFWSAAERRLRHPHSCDNFTRFDQRIGLTDTESRRSCSHRRNQEAQ